jgi:hypothetical protein
MALLIPSRAATKITQNFAGDGTYTIPNGVVVDLIELKPTADLAAVEIGTTPGGDEIMTATPVTAAGPNLLGTLLKGPVTLYFTGITAATQIIFYRKN